MSRYAYWVMLVASGAMCVGCQPAKELPALLPTGPQANETPTLPTVSDPAAKAYIEKAVSKMTGGKPELLARGRVSRAVFKGRLYKLNQTTPSEVTRTIAAVWPDRLTDTDQVQEQGQTGIVSAYLHLPHLAVFNGGAETVLPNPTDYQRTFMADEIAQFWMPLLLPVTDPKAVVFDLQSVTGTSPATGQPQPIQMLKLAWGEYATYQLTFDAKTDLLVRVEWATHEQSTRRRKQWTAGEHKPSADGILLPIKFEYWHDTLRAEQFDVEKWEFPATIDDAEFSPPKK
jgi:hypothetical protein